ncbi:MAG: aminopeptidase P family protein [Chloroflexi bacterium]|jgi:Xaa-Pro aminopeptidase|nr:aminopeptidase P family protein [Chloroflexota bacterium]
MPEATIQREKLAQAIQILREQDVDCWLTFVRETGHNADPALRLISNSDVTWHTALIVTQKGERIAIVGRYEVENFKRMGCWDEVIGYDQSIQPALLSVLDRLAPRQIALNYSESDTAADGLSHGMFLTLQRYLQGKPYALISAERVLSRLRGRKTATEIARIRAAVRLTEQIVDAVTAALKVGMTERQVADFIHAEMRRHGVSPSWDAGHCPTVTCGAESPVGHVSPSDQHAVKAGELVRIDLGVVLDEYVSDLQRVWYIQPQGETTIPEPVRHAFDSVRAAIEAAAAALKPGVQGWTVDEAARRAIVERGYPEYQHAVGHGIGRTVHDGATLLGPRWERYGNTPYGVVEAGNCFTLELGVHVPGYGLVSLEEDVLVTESGVEWLSTPQTDLIVVKA